MNNQNTQIQLLGHATFKVITPENKIIIVDPWLIENPFIPKGLDAQDLIDIMLITHGHEDHFDIHIADIIQKTRPKIVANNICRWHLLEQGIEQQLIEPINLGGTIHVHDVSITMVNAFHHAHIYKTDTSVISPHMANGFVIRMTDGTAIYFAGDTCVFGDMKLIGEIYKPDIAVLPIGNRFTMGAMEASVAVKLIQAQHVIPFHYGTFGMLDQTPDEFIELVKETAHVHILNAGDILNCSQLV